MAFEKRKDDKGQKGEENRDPISGQPGAHPIGTAAGAATGAAGGVAGGAAAGAATGAAAGGPAGAAIGGVVGAVGGGLAGKAIAERINPTDEDAYWREHYRDEPYYDESYSYEDYQGAYRTGYEGYARWGTQGKNFNQVEPDLRRDYEQRHGKSKLSWDRARQSVRAAWERVHHSNRDLGKYVDYDVYDRDDSKIGTLQCLWSDHTGEPAFIGVKTGWLFGKTHVVPADQVELCENSRKIRLPYTKDKVKEAPAYDTDSEMDEAREWEIRSYYGISQPKGGQRTRGQRASEPSHQRATPEQATIKLSEEELKVGKREVEAGGVRLRKIIRTETVNQPIELQREEIVIERVPAEEAKAVQQKSFQEADVFIPLRREEAVIEKQERIREEVRVRKKKHTDKQQVSGQVRREDVEIQPTGEAREDRRRSNPAEEIREREDVPRSRRRHE